MTGSESRALATAGGILLAASLLRVACAGAGGPPLLPADSADVVDELVAASREREAAEARRRAPLRSGERLDPNRAPPEELDRLPGVGPSTAAAIVAVREEGGGFREPEDLLRVPGIGEKTLRRIRGHLDLDGLTAGPSAPAPLSPASVLLRSERRGEGGDGGPAGDAPVRLNRADAAALEALPGVGPVIARRIVEERERRRGFRRVDELLAVKGIGPATLERIRPRVTLRR